MPDLTPELLPALRARRLPGLDLGPDVIFPDYEGGSIYNLPASLCGLLGAPPLGGPQLRSELVGALSGDVRRVIVVLVDALALHRLRRWLDDGAARIWRGLADRGVLAPLTSVSPSTTSTCLPTLWSGLSPAQHGFVGYELWLKEFGVVANMIRHSPFTVRTPPGSLESAGFKPEAALPSPTLGEHLSAHGIATYAFQPFAIRDSGLSRMLFRQVKVRPYASPIDLWISLREHLADRAAERMLVWAYWSELDFVSHNYGPDHPRVQAEFEAFSDAFGRHFLDPLPPDLRDGTVLILTADHGQIHTQKDPHFDLRSHPGLSRRLHLLPTGENRWIYLHIRPGQTEAVSEYLQRNFRGMFSRIDPPYAIANGLFGPGTPHPGLADRAGDLMALANGASYLWWGQKANPIHGRHGGLSADEMLVPFLAVRLEAST